MHFTSPQNFLYPIIVNKFHDFPPFDSDTDHSLRTFIKNNVYISQHFISFFLDDDKTTPNNDFLDTNPFFPNSINFSKLSSSNDNDEIINILNEIDSNSIDEIDSKRLLYIDLLQEKSIEEKTKKDQKPIFKIIKLVKLSERKKVKLSGERYMEKDNILIKIGRNFFNIYLVGKITKIIQELGSKLYFEKFPRNFILNAVKKKNKKNIWKMKLIEIFVDEELYTKEDKVHFTRNKEVIKKLKSEKYKKILEDTEFNIILNMKISDVYNEYLNSDEYEIKIKSFKNYGHVYIDKFQQIARNLIKNFKN